MRAREAKTDVEKMTENDCCEWKHTAVNPQDKGVRYALRAAIE